MSKAGFYKTLEFRGDKEKALGKFAVIHGNYFGGCDIPQLMAMETSVRKLEKLYPNHNFKDVNLIIVKVSEIETNTA